MVTQVFNAETFNKLVENFDQATFESYYHALVDSWLMRKRVFYVNYAEFISIEDWWLLNEQLEDVSKLVLGKVNSENVDEANKVLENVKTELAQFLLKAINLRKSDLREYFLAKTNNLANTLVGDFDWSVKLNTSSDKLAKVNEPLCNVSLTKLADASRAPGHREEPVYFEMTRSELGEFLSTLETIKKNMDVLE